MRFAQRGVLCASMFGVLALLRPLLADEPKPDVQEPQARQLFDEMVKVYKALPAYSDHGEVSIALKLPGDVQTQSIKTSATFARPNKLVLDAGHVRLVSDGTRLTTVVFPLKKYLVAPAPEALSLDVLADNPAGALLFGGPSGPAMNILWNLLVGNDPTSALLRPDVGLKLEAERQLEGKNYQSLLIAEKDRPDVRLLIAPDSKLVQRIELVIDAEDLKQVKAESQVSDASVVWNAGTIATDVPAEQTFGFEVPAGFTKVAELSSRRAPAAERKDPLEELVGKPAPDFTLTVLDGPEKTRLLSKADLAGKVVLIDFWATWCPPCMAELPEIQKLVDAYAKTNPKGVVVIAVSQDNEPGELEDVRKLVEKTLASKELKLADGPVGMVALDPIKTIGNAFHIAAIPTVVVIDGKGIVQSVHVGYRPDARETLSDEIDALLHGRSLFNAKNDADHQNDAGALKD